MNRPRWCDFNSLSEAVTAQLHTNEHSIHGPSHWRRVEQNGRWLCERTNADEFIVRLFAWFHDSRRVNDFVDPQHGARGAEYAALSRGKLFDLEDDAFERLSYACTWHTDKDHSDDITIGTCWDADRLDLGRVGAIPSADYMSTPFGREVAQAGSFDSFISKDKK
jgi:uncharacterized protein